MMSNLPAKPACGELFHLLRNRLTEQDLREFLLLDQGYDDYVRVWMPIFRTGFVPERNEFDLAEVIGLTAWSNPGDFDEPNRFRIFRLWTLCVTLKLYFSDNATCFHSPNYVAIHLIDDARDLNDPQILSLVGDILTETAAQLSVWIPPEMENPFLYAAEMIWAQRIGNFDRADSAAKMLLSEEHRMRTSGEDYFSVDPRFLFGLKHQDILDTNWHRAFAELKNPNNCRETQVVIDALARERGLLASFRRFRRKLAQRRIMNRWKR